MDKTLYTKDSIESLSPREHVQLRAGMYIGSTARSTQLVIEVFSNALDEFNLGHGDTITVAYSSKTNIITVADNGQGFPINEVREDGETILQASFDVINTSGKYSDDGVYGGVSLGLNGVGGKATNFLSTELTVKSNRDGQYESIDFVDGIFKTRSLGKTEEPNGTTVSFRPNPQFFEDATPDVNLLRKTFNDICGMCPKLTIVFIVDDKKEIIHHPEGIDYLLSDAIGKTTEIISHRLLFQEKRDKYALDCGLTYSSGSAANIVAYVNYGLTERGPHIQSLKSTLTRVMNKWAREQNLLKEKDSNIGGESLQEGLNLVFNLVSPGIAYDAQTKATIVSKDFVPFLNDVFAAQLELWLDSNPQDGKIIIEKALLARKAAEAAKKAREAVKNGQQKKNKKVKILHPDKLKDAEYLGENSILLCVEGLSAGSTIAVSRDNHTGILMLRGKLINAFTNTDERLYKNEEIQLLFQALGLTPHHYDSKDLRYGRVGICVDSDADGLNISMLITSALTHFFPEFVNEGRLCWLRSPLYIVKNKGQQDQYFFNDKEMNEAKKNGIQGVVQRNKGLGSLSPDQAKNSMFGKNQHLDILKPSSDSFDVLHKLMGKDVAPRKHFIMNYIDFSEVRE